jgi:hypothetical protein
MEREAGLGRTRTSTKWQTPPYSEHRRQGSADDPRKRMRDGPQGLSRLRGRVRQRRQRLHGRAVINVRRPADFTVRTGRTASIQDVTEGSVQHHRQQPDRCGLPVHVAGVDAEHQGPVRARHSPGGDPARQQDRPDLLGLYSQRLQLGRHARQQHRRLFGLCEGAGAPRPSGCSAGRPQVRSVSHRLLGDGWRTDCALYAADRQPAYKTGEIGRSAASARSCRRT